MSATCDSCHAPVIWTKTEKGKRMPVDVEPRPDGNIVLLDRVDEEGRHYKLAHYVQPGGMAMEDRYVSHFFTCPDAEKWRRA